MSPRAAALLLLVCVALPARAQGSARCPVDQTPLRLTSTPWNLAGGVDSDGCGYAIDAQGARRVVGLEQVIECPTCHVALLRAHLRGEPLAAEQAAAVKAVVAKLRAGWGAKAKQALTPQRRHELAAAVYAAVGVAPFGGKQDRDALVGTLTLRAAWAARGRAVLGGPDGGYRPRSLAEGRRQLEALEQRARHDPSRDPEVRAVDAQLTALDGARSGLVALGRDGDDTPVRRLAVLRGLGKLRAVENQLLRRKQALLERQEQEGRLSDRELRLALVRAWIRAGEVGRWKPALAKLEQKRATWAIARLIREACDEEARLLQAAEGALAKALARAATPAARARLAFLAGDAARRRGDAKAAAPRLEAAVKLAPKSPAGQRAAALREP